MSTNKSRVPRANEKNCSLLDTPGGNLVFHSSFSGRPTGATNIAIFQQEETEVAILGPGHANPGRAIDRLAETHARILLNPESTPRGQVVRVPVAANTTSLDRDPHSGCERYEADAREVLGQLAQPGWSWTYTGFQE